MNFLPYASGEEAVSLDEALRLPAALQQSADKELAQLFVKTSLISRKAQKQF